MPGYIIHLTEAEMVLDILKKEKVFAADISDQWEKMFFCGNLIPDAVPKNEKKYSHFWDEKEKGNILNVPCISKFLNKYPLDLKEPVLCGYFTHLYLDKVFYNDYIEQCIGFYNNDNKREYKEAEISYARIFKTGEIVSISKLFSEKYIYGDYTQLNEYFINRYKIQVPWYIVPNKISIEEVGQYDLEKVFYELQTFLKKNKNGQRDLKVFSKESLDNFLVNTSQIVVDILMKK